MKKNILKIVFFLVLIMYLFYHTSERALSLIPEGSPERDFIQWRRSVCVAPLYYNEDGTIRPVEAKKSFKIVCGK